MKKDKVYAWCTCGYSGNQPLCDGSHNSIRVPDLKLKPVRFIPEEDMTVWLCNCKQTSNRFVFTNFASKMHVPPKNTSIFRPFCDGTHKTLVDEDKKAGLFD